jgi:hypothetical protein
MFLGVEKKMQKRTKTDPGAVVASVNQKVTGPCGCREPTHRVQNLREPSVNPT